MILVFDSSALLAYLRREPGGNVTQSLLADKGNDRFVHGLNLVEVFYDQRRAGGEDVAQAALNSLAALGLQTREDLDEALREDAGRIKADCRRVSLADCCGLALTRRLGGTFLTTDRHELDRDEIKALCPIRFIR